MVVLLYRSLHHVALQLLWEQVAAQLMFDRRASGYKRLK
jgi:hypothetical protein